MFYARQIPYDVQEAPAWDRNKYQNIFIEGSVKYGSSNEKSHAGNTYAKLKKCLNDIHEEITAYKRRYKTIPNILPIIQRTMPKSDGSAYSNKEIAQLVMLMNCIWDDENDRTAYTAAMSIVCPGRNYVEKVIYGVDQSDWNVIIYDANEYSRHDISMFVCEYFDMGTEWIVCDKYFNTIPDDISSVISNADERTVYCHSTDLIEIRDEIAGMLNAKPDNVVLFEFEGYNMSPVHTKI